MIEHATVSVVSLLAAFLTFYTGFGLGTLLLPAFALFMPVQHAIAATAVVHLLNNLWKAALVGRYVERSLIIPFGVSSAAGAFFGAWFLAALGTPAVLAVWHASDRTFGITAVNVTVGAVMLGFAILELMPGLDSLSFHKRLAIPMGLASGFFGGLSGHQGALRSAFLSRSVLSPRALVATRCVCACIVDFTRLGVYLGATGAAWASFSDLKQASLIVWAAGSALAGSLIGSRLLDKATMPVLRRLTGVALVVLAIALAAGLLSPSPT